MLSLHYALPFCKGDRSRSIIYVSVTYRLPMRGMGQMLARWHKADPPDAVEHWRNDQIDALQHTRNPFIDSSEAVDLLEMIQTQVVPPGSAVTAGGLLMTPWVQQAQTPRRQSPVWLAGGRRPDHTVTSDRKSNRL